MLTLGWFSTGRGEGSLGLFRFIQQRIESGHIDACISFVFSNRADGEAEGSDRFFRQVREYGLPLLHLSSRGFRRARGGSFTDHREEFDREAMAALKEFSPDLCVLAGYMLIVGPEMCRRYSMVNLHPALPWGPTGTWQEVIWELIGSRAKSTGAMVHLVTEEVDRGPVIAYFSIPIVGGEFDAPWAEVEGRSLVELQSQQGEELPLFRLIRREGYRREPYLLAATLSYLASGKVNVSRGCPMDAGGNLVEPLCLSAAVERESARA